MDRIDIIYNKCDSKQRSTSNTPARNILSTEPVTAVSAAFLVELGFMHPGDAETGKSSSSRKLSNVLNLVKSPIERLETAVTSAKRDLDKVRATQETAVTRAAELADLVASAFADDAQNAESLERQHFEAELRVKSLATAVERARSRHDKAMQDLLDAKAQDDIEASAAKCRDLAKALEKAKPAAAEATRKIAEIVGSLPTTGHYPTHVLQGIEHWVPGAFGFF
jgi:hypothetical protein